MADTEPNFDPHGRAMTVNSRQTSLGLPHHLVRAMVDQALEEDLGLAGDLTTQSVILGDKTVTATISARQQGTIAGLALAERAFSNLDPNTEFQRHKNDGEEVIAAAPILTLVMGAKALLIAERVALNFLGPLSGIATLTREFCNAISGTNARIAATRKTTPGLRAAEKYAVTVGGGLPHRYGLNDAVLIKDNHIAIAGGIEIALKRATTQTGHMVKVQVEVDNLDQLKLALDYPIDSVLLDNMDAETLKKAVDLVNGKCLTEASGSVTLETVKEIAETGVDIISVGALTHSAPNLDVGLDIETLAS